MLFRSNFDFSFWMYEKILQSFLEKGYEIVTVSDNRSKNKTLILRHDVDRKPGNALKMARFEASLRIRSTYYFRVVSNRTPLEIIKTISKLDHEIGYHYENLSRMKGDYQKAIFDFKKNLKLLRKVVPIKTIAMHGSPSSKYCNLDLWKKYNYKKYDLEIEPYLDINYKDILYFTDTGRSWSSEKYNVRDRVELAIPKARESIKTSWQLISFINNRLNDQSVFLSVHPERWSNDVIDYFYQLFFDSFVNLSKYFLIKLRK